MAASEFRGRTLADLRVVGRKTPVTVYELTGDSTDPAPAEWETFDAGLTHFREGRFAEAKVSFEQLPDDPAAQRYVQRCVQLSDEPPTSWDGVWELTEK